MRHRSVVFSLLLRVGPLKPWAIYAHGNGARGSQVGGGPAQAPAGDVRGLQVFRGDVFQDLLLKRPIGRQPLRPGVFLLRVFHPARLIQIKPAILLAPSVKILLGDTGFPAGKLGRLPLAHAHSIGRSRVTIFSGLNLFFAMTMLLSKTISNILSGKQKEPVQVRVTPLFDQLKMSDLRSRAGSHFPCKLFHVPITDYLGRVLGKATT